MKWKTESRTKRRPAGCYTLFCILFSLICLGGCGVQIRAPELPGQETGPREVVLWSYYETKQQKEGLDRLVEGFNNSQDEYMARWEYQGPSSEFKKLLSIGVAEGKLPDVVLIDNPDMICPSFTRKSSPRCSMTADTMACLFAAITWVLCITGKCSGKPVWSRLRTGKNF